MQGWRTQNKTSFWIATVFNGRDISGLTRGQSPLKHPGVKTQRGVKCWPGVGGPAATFITSYRAEIQKCGAIARLCEAAGLNKIINTLPRLFAGYNITVLLINLRITLPGLRQTEKKIVALATYIYSPEALLLASCRDLE